MAQLEDEILAEQSTFLQKNGLSRLYQLTNRELLLYVLKNKFKAEERYFKFSITPDSDEDWSTIEEARDYGIPIASVGDTSDKIVLHPGHILPNIAAEYKLFDYFWGDGRWSDRQCYCHIDDHIKDSINSLLAYVGVLLNNLGFRVEPYYAGGTCKGYLDFDNMYFYKETLDLEDRQNAEFRNGIFKHMRDSGVWYGKDYVLFVFGINRNSPDSNTETLEGLIKRIKNHENISP